MVQSIILRSSHFASMGRNIVPLASFFVAFFLWCAICFVSRRPGEQILQLFLLFSVGMIFCSLVVLWHYRRRAQHGQEGRIPFRWIFLSALVLRLVSLFGDPLFEDDYFRYMWDGFQTATTNDPYTLAPEVFFDEEVPEIFEPILSFINYPDVATVYGPVVQWLFAAGYLIAPAEIWPLQLMASLADLLVLIILFKLGARNACLLYAWSPLLLKEFSLTAHPDIYAVLGMMFSIYAVYKNRALLAGIALALAFGSKVFAILALPYLLTRSWSIRFWMHFLSAFLVTLVAITLAFGTVKIWVPEGLVAMADSWFFNAPLYLVLLKYLEFQFIKILLLLLFVIYGFFVFCKRLIRVRTQKIEPVSLEPWVHSPAAFRGDWLYALFLLALPVVNSWYLVWVLPFAVLFPRYWNWTASFAVLLSYWNGSNIGGFATAAVPLEADIVAIEYAVIVALPLAVGLVTAIKTKMNR